MSVSKTEQSILNFPRSLSRDTLNLIFHAAMESREYRFARQMVLSWLSVYPGDLAANAMLAKVFMAEGKIGQAIQVYERICRVDPEDILSQKALAFAYGEAQPEDYKRTLVSVYILGQRVDPSIGMPGWSTILRNARKALVDDRLDQAETLVFQAMALNQEHVLIGVTHLELIRARKDDASQAKFAEIYQSSWPETVLFKLALAEAKLAAGDEAAAVNLLHQCVAVDAGGQVSTRWWGKQHPYRPLWPEQLETSLNLGVPASVAARLGWNRLAASSAGDSQAGEPGIEEDRIQDKGSQTAHSQPAAAANQVQPPGTNGDPAHPPEEQDSSWLREAEADFEKLAKKMKAPAMAKSDGRFPVYVIFTTKTGLRSQFGEQSMQVIDQELQSLAEVIRRRSGWGAMVFYPDDIETTGKLGLATVGSNDPGKLKLALKDLDGALAKKGSRIGAVLIVGGAQVVPYHRLPNPTDDVDEEVLSDNPYATLDSNYFVPEWPVGRLPGESGADAGLLLQQIRQSVKYHTQAVQSPKTLQRLRGWINFLNLLSILRRVNGKVSSIGYTASVWRRSSLAAYRPVGEGRTLLVSPPTASGNFSPTRLTHPPLSYYNLHGLADTAEWYGQRDPFEVSESPEYPVALSIKDLPKNGSAPKVVFTEACYGGFISEKTEKESIALRFMSIGSMAFVGSTCISYGSVTTPLVGADLLGFLFWSALKEGYSVGEALAQAKVGLVREMTKRQGFLDGEDQKTLISFVLYGDPLVYHDGIQVNPKRLVRNQQRMAVKTVSDERSEPNSAGGVSDRIILQAKQAVEHYLPGLDRLEVQMKSQRLEMGEKNHRAARAHLGKQTAQKQYEDRTVVIFTRKVQIADKTHIRYARVTINREGKLMKMAVSR
jgi:tetratricopeptide (TPR) repeat protein